MGNEERGNARRLKRKQTAITLNYSLRIIRKDLTKYVTKLS